MKQMSGNGIRRWVERTLGAGYLFGAPVGDLGWFASLLMGTATGFAAFFAATFLRDLSGY